MDAHEYQAIVLAPDKFCSLIYGCITKTSDYLIKDIVMRWRRTVLIKALIINDSYSITW